MATKKTTATAAETENVTEAVQVEAENADTVKVEKKFSVENLAKNCRQLFGVSSCTFAGATAGLTGEYTVSEMKSIIKKWCGKEIK